MSWTRSNLDRSVERNEGAILVDIISQLYTSNDDVTSDRDKSNLFNF